MLKIDLRYVLFKAHFEYHSDVKSKKSCQDCSCEGKDRHNVLIDEILVRTWERIQKLIIHYLEF